MMGPERLGNLFKINGVWQRFTIRNTKHLCDVCNHTYYSWKKFDIHKKTHTEKEHLKVLWQTVDAKYL